MRNILSGIYLMICAVQDLQRRKISIPVSVIAGSAALVLDLAVLRNASGEIIPYLAGLLPGILLLLLSLVSGGASGVGDGICFLVLGAFLGAQKTWILLLAALVCAGVGGGAWMMFCGAGRKAKLPFLVFAAAVWSVQTAADLAGTVWQL